MAIRMKALIATAILLSPTAASADPKAGAAKWVEITRPMLACWNIAFDEMDAANEASIREMRANMLSWRPGAALPKACTELKIGARYILAPLQPDNAVYLEEYCHGCVPYITPLFAPPVRNAGKYFKPAAAPKGAEKVEG